MALVMIGKTLGIFLVAAFVLSWLAGKIVQFILFRLLVFGAVLAVGWTQARGELHSWIEARYKEVADNPKDDAAFRYLAGDFVPAMRKLGGTIPPSVEELLKDRAKNGSTCHKALARKAMGEDADPVGACR